MQKQRIALGLVAGVLVVTALLFSAAQLFQPASAAAGPHQAFIDKAKNQLSQQTGVDTKNITLVSVEEVDWADSSLGCPQRGESYLQVITPGFKIILQSGGTNYEFHSTANPDGHMVQCGGSVLPQGVR